MKRAILVVTSAGLGLRLKEYSFKKYGKYLDKPLVKLKGKTLLEWSIKPFYPLITAGILNFSDIYVVIREDQNEKQFKEVIIRINKKINIIKIEKLSRGPAHTAYEACKKISKVRSIKKLTLIVSDSDHTFRSDSLINFLKNNKKRKNNAFCTLKSVANPEKWGYVIKNENKQFISGEKDILSKDKSTQNAAEFLIGCYLYHDMDTLKKAIIEFDKSKFKLSESHHSLVLSLLSKSDSVSTINSNWGLGLGTPLQLEKAENSLISFEGNREPSTYIIDIDGVILHHDKGRFSESGDFVNNPKPINNNKELINDLYDYGSYIVLFSSRPETSYEKTNNDLKNIGLKFHRLILGATSGTRYLINDLKPSNISINTAEGVNIKRDQSIKRNYIFQKFDFSKDCSKGSGAYTMLLKDQTENKTIVRKWTDSRDEKTIQTLYKQFSFLKIIRNYIKGYIPEILDWKFESKGISYYDMSYIHGNNLSSIDNKESDLIFNKLTKILSLLYESNSKNIQKNNLNHLSKKIIDDKLKPTIYKSEIELEHHFKFSEFIPNQLFKNIILELEKIYKDKYIWQNHMDCLIHGDLTYENILVENEFLYLIDPLGSTMDIRFNGSMEQPTTPIFDLGKLFQSLISKYESWAYLNKFDSEIYIRNFSIDEELLNIHESIKKSKVLVYFFEQYIDGNIIKDGLFSLAQTLIRVCPYRIKTNYYHSGFVCLLKSYSILKYLNNL